jgi:hypothetical protein
MASLVLPLPALPALPIFPEKAKTIASDDRPALGRRAAQEEGEEAAAVSEGEEEGVRSAARGCCAER